MSNPEPLISIEVVFCQPKKQVLKKLECPVGISLNEAITLSEIQEAFPEISLDNFSVAVWGQLRKRDDKIREGDRIEILRPLEIDPREARRIKVGS